jgi:hypothetical protein
MRVPRNEVIRSYSQLIGVSLTFRQIRSMRTIKPAEMAKNYVTLSNNHDLALITALFAADATYYSAYFGEYKGSDAIYAMMISFFERFPDAHWEVAEYRNIDHEGAEFAFTMTGTDASSNERVERRGLERIYFTPAGLIRHIAVYKPDDFPGAN